MDPLYVSMPNYTFPMHGEGSPNAYSLAILHSSALFLEWGVVPLCWVLILRTFSSKTVLFTLVQKRPLRTLKIAA